MVTKKPIDLSKKAITPLMRFLMRELSSSDLATLRAGLDRVPGTDEGRAELWKKFSTNFAAVLLRRDRNHEISSFCFYEELEDGFGDRQFNILAAYSFRPSKWLTEVSFPMMEAFALSLGCDCMRVQVARAGLVRKIKAMPGWELSPYLAGGEFVLFKRLCHR